MNFNLAAWSIKHRQIIYFFAVLAAVMGIYSYNALGRSEDPNFTVKEMVISSSWPGATAKEMELQVTDKIEKVIQTVPDVDFVTSYSRPGVSVVTVDIKEAIPGVEVKKRWQEVRNLVNDAKKDLPSDLYGPYYNDHFDDVYGNIYAITSDSYSYEDMRKVASDIKDQFVLVPDVKKVELVGVQPERIYIQMDNNKLSQLGLSVSSLASTIQAETNITPSGMTHDDNNNSYLRLTGLPDTVKNIENILISAQGRTFRLSDIATIKRSYAEPAEPKMYFNGQPAIGIALSMSDGGNNIELGQNLGKKIAKLQKNMPLGFELHMVSDQPQVVKNAIGEFMEGLVEAIAIVLVMSLLSLGRKSGYVISCCIPLVLLTSFVGMYIMGIDLHKISLGSLIIALGMLVDDAIVVVEMIELKVNEGVDKIEACSFAFKSCSKPLLTGTIITCLSFMPIAYSKTTAGEFASALFPVVSLTLMISFFIAATVAPVLGYEWITPDRLLKAQKQEEAGEKASAKPAKAQNAAAQKEPGQSEATQTAAGSQPAQTAGAGQNGNSRQPAPAYNMFDNPFYKKFRKVLNWALHHRAPVIGVTLLIFASALGVGTLLKQEFFPASVRPEILTELNLPEGSSLAASDAAARKLTDLLKDNPDVASIATYVGKSVPRFVLVLDPVQPRDNYAQLVVVAKDTPARLRLEKQIKKLVADNLPEVQSYSRSIPLGPPTPYPVMIRVSAPSDILARKYADEVRNVMLQNKHITMVRFDWMEKAKSVKVAIDTDRLRQLGLTRKEVASALQAEVSGYTVSQYYEGDQAINLVFRLNPVDRNNIQELGLLSIPTSKGAVQLNQVANITYDAEENMIWRRNLLPTITVNAGITDDATGNDVTDEIMNATKELRQNMPDSCSIEIGGPAEKSVNTTKALLRPVPAMLVLMMILLMMELQDVRKVIVVLLTAPLGLIGLCYGLFLFNTTLGIMAEIGALALIGIIIRNTIVLVDQIDQHLALGMDPEDAVTESVIIRFRPIMLAAMVAVLGLVPLFPSAFWRGLAVGMACGLAVATVITLLVMPVIYCVLFRVKCKN